MLGSLRFSAAWKWAAFGKHPVAGDYFKAGPDDLFFTAFSGWIENGYREVCGNHKNASDLYSWRFWAKGHQKDTLICGVGRDSFDSIGRPYPLIVMGTGTLPNWQKNLGLLPFALEKTWIQMEYLATKRYIDFTQIENDIRRLPIPVSEWTELQNEALRRCEGWPWAGDLRKEILQRMGGDGANEPDFFVPLGTNACLDAITSVGLWLSVLAEKDTIAPNATFLGGISNATYLAIFRRPLVVPDFIRLWSVGLKKL